MPAGGHAMLDQWQTILLGILHVDRDLPDQALFSSFKARDWEALVGYGIEYGLGCQLDAFISSRAELGQTVPEESRELLKRATEAQLLQNFRQYRRLGTVLVACAEAGLEIIPFKGLWLAEHIYRDPKARRSGDIDLLVRPKDMPEFTRIMRSLGCPVPAGVTDLRALAPASNECALEFRNNETRLDVHWNIAHPVLEAPIDEESFWARSEASEVGGASCRAFRLEDHLVYLCFHASIHHRFAFVGPRSLLDIAMMIRQPPRPIDWEDVVGRAHSLGWSRGVWLTLELVREHLGVAPPIEHLNALKPKGPASRAVCDQALATLFLEPWPSPVPERLFAFRDAPWREKPRLLWNRLFPTRQELATQFMTPLEKNGFWLSYLRRLGHVATYLPLLWSVIRPGKDQQEQQVRSRALREWLDGPGG